MGSITHSSDLAAAVVVPKSMSTGIGIDCERVMDTAAASEVVGRVFPEAASLGIAPGRIADLEWSTFVTVVFSAKESVYKCLHPLCRIFFDFDAVRLEGVEADAGTLRFRWVQALGGELPPGVLLSADFRVEQ